NSTKALVNDIDAWLASGAQTTLPWVLSTFPRTDSLRKLPTRKTDRVNNVEYITLDNPAPGTHTLHLKSPTLNANQVVSVAYWQRANTSFEWDYPLGADVLEGNKNNLLVWQAAAGQRGDLYEQLNNGPWRLVQAQLDLNNYFFYETPNVFSTAKLKMVVAGNEFLTNEFVSSPAMPLKVAFACTDSIGFTWNALPNATSYKLFQLNGNYLSPLANTTATFKSFPSSIPKYLSVAPVYNGTEGLKSSLIDYTEQGASCFLNAFSASRTTDQQVTVQTNLSSWYGIKRVEVYKTTSQKSKMLWQTLLPTTSLNLVATDEELVAGKMLYQPQIVFNNGATLSFAEATVLIEEKGKVTLFPNPVDASADLNILSEGNGTFQLFDLMGRLVLSLDLTERLKSIDILNLPNGLYTYQWVVQSRVTDKGRLIKL
ncbi:MAG: T9SS type A sorting domain-containing protein, partial [Flammeovirgaceae bacterium]